MPSAVPYLTSLKIVPERIPADAGYPFDLPTMRGLEIHFRKPVTFFVGENGTGKSTLIEGLAALCRLPVSGGSRNELSGNLGPDADSPLACALRPIFRKRPKDGYFLRAEFLAHFASLLDQRKQDPEFWGDPFTLYGGRSLHQRSHGEAFFAVLRNRIKAGLFLFDEPESALSPQSQLALLTLIDDLVSEKKSQFVIATHSPILLTYPSADILSFDHVPLRSVGLEETSHYQITRGILENPQLYWKHLREP